MVCSHLGPRKKKRRGLTWDLYTSGKESVNEMWQLLYPVRNRLTSHRLLQHVRDCPCTAGHHSAFHSWISLHCFLTFFFFLLFFVLFCFLLKPILLLEQTWDTRTVSETYGHPKDWPTPSICPTTPSVGASSVGRLQLIYRESPIQPYRKKTYREAFLFGVQLNLRDFPSLSVSFSPELTMLSENPTSNKVARKMLTRASGAASVGTEQETREWTWRNAVKS